MHRYRPPLRPGAPDGGVLAGAELELEGAADEHGIAMILTGRRLFRH